MKKSVSVKIDGYLYWAIAAKAEETGKTIKSITDDYIQQGMVAVTSRKSQKMVHTSNMDWMPRVDTKEKNLFRKESTFGNVVAVISIFVLVWLLSLLLF